MTDSLVLTPVEKEWVEWSHIDYLRIPFIDELISHEPGRMVFNGYFYINDAAMPVERVFHSNKGEFHVEIYEKNTNKLVSRIKEQEVSNITKIGRVDISFINPTILSNSPKESKIFRFSKPVYFFSRNSFSKTL